MTTQPDSQILPTGPPPQTARGVLSSNGMPYIYPNIATPSTIKNTLERQHLMTFIQVNTGKVQELLTTDIPYRKSKMSQLYSDLLLDMATYITADIYLDFWLNAPPQASGVFLITYLPVSTTLAVFGNKHRSFKTIWDINQKTPGLANANTDPRKISIPLNPPHLGFKRMCTGEMIYTHDEFVPIKLDEALFKFGRIKIETLQPIIAGNLFPDEFFLYIFIRYKNVQLSCYRGYLTTETEGFYNTHQPE